MRVRKPQLNCRESLQVCSYYGHLLTVFEWRIGVHVSYDIYVAQSAQIHQLSYHSVLYSYLLHRKLKTGKENT
jgi:hypothetical protein